MHVCRSRASSPGALSRHVAGRDAIAVADDLPSGPVPAAEDDLDGGAAFVVDGDKTELATARVHALGVRPALGGARPVERSGVHHGEARATRTRVVAVAAVVDGEHMRV